jgi:hypothetical protein
MSAGVFLYDSNAGLPADVKSTYPFLSEALSWCREQSHSWQAHFMQHGNLKVPHPADGAVTLLSRPIVGSWNTMFLSNPAPFGFSIVASCLGHGMPIVGILLHNERSYVYICHHKYSVKISEIEQYLLHRDGGLPGGIPSVASDDRSVSVVIGETNFAHFLHNEISGLMLALTDADSKTVKVSELCIMREPLGPTLEIFPGLASIPTRKINPDDLPYMGVREDVILLSSARLAAKQRDDVITYLDQLPDTRPDSLFDSVINSPRPRLMLGLRSHSRVVTNVDETYLALASLMKSRYGEITVVVDGFSLPYDYDSNSNYARWFDDVVDASRQRVDEFIHKLNAAGISHIFNTTTDDVPTALWLSRQCDYYFTNLGTQQHKAGWFSSAQGIVHGSPGDLTQRSVDWFMHLVEGQKPFTIFPDYLYTNVNSDGSNGAAYRFSAPEEVAAWILENEWL